MKLARALTVFALAALFAYPVIAHHAAQDIIDEELWNMIDEMVADFGKRISSGGPGAAPVGRAVGRTERHAHGGTTISAQTTFSAP